MNIDGIMKELAEYIRMGDHGGRSERPVKTDHAGTEHGHPNRDGTQGHL
jgi:hypothetical protein